MLFIACRLKLLKTKEFCFDLNMQLHMVMSLSVYLAVSFVLLCGSIIGPYPGVDLAPVVISVLGVCLILGVVFALLLVS